MSSEQELAWRGAFGDEYTKRNGSHTGRELLWLKLLKPMDKLSSICEIGAGRGANLDVLTKMTDAEVIGVEPNELARQSCNKIVAGTAQACPIGDAAVDLSFTCGVLIHIPPDELGDACDEIYRISNRYIACIEYFSDEPQSKQYRGRDNLLFKRDFGSYWLDRFPDLEVLDYGFFWKRMTGLDNLTYWVFAKY